MEAATLPGEATPEGSTYVRPQEMEWRPTRFDGISIKVLYEDPGKGEMTCLLRWEPGASLPFHRHPEIEQSYVLEGSFHDHDGIARAGEFVWRRPRLVSRDTFRRRLRDPRRLSQAERVSIQHGVRRRRRLIRGNSGSERVFGTAYPR